jgi:hypothetical protein
MIIDYNKTDLLGLLDLYVKCDCDHCKQKINEVVKSLRNGIPVKLTLNPDEHNHNYTQIHIS